MPGTKQQRLVEDRLWELIEPLLPPRPAPKGPRGRPRVDERAALEGHDLVQRATRDPLNKNELGQAAHVAADARIERAL